MKQKYFLFIILLFLLLFSHNAIAVPISTPPSGFGSDIDGNGYFIPNDIVIGYEIYDYLETFGGGTEFGFYFQGDPAERYTIFDALDNISNSAAISFTAGIVLDIDDNTVQTVFVNQNKSIGFYINLLGTTLYTDANLNGGVDVAGAFPSLSLDDFYLLKFQTIDAQTQAPVTLSFNLVAGITPVPEPSSIFLLVSGLLVFCKANRKFL